MNRKPYSVVLSLAGHDKGRLFAVIGLADEFHVLIADGKLRKIEKPKKKKKKHIKAIGYLNLTSPTALTNRQLSRALRGLGETEMPVTEGGFIDVQG